MVAAEIEKFKEKKGWEDLRKEFQRVDKGDWDKAESIAKASGKALGVIKSICEGITVGKVAEVSRILQSVAYAGPVFAFITPILTNLSTRKEMETEVVDLINIIGNMMIALNEVIKNVAETINRRMLDDEKIENFTVDIGSYKELFETCQDALVEIEKQNNENFAWFKRFGRTEGQRKIVASFKNQIEMKLAISAAMDSKSTLYRLFAIGELPNEEQFMEMRDGVKRVLGQIISINEEGNHFMKNLYSEQRSDYRKSSKQHAFIVFLLLGMICYMPTLARVIHDHVKDIPSLVVEAIKKEATLRKYRRKNGICQYLHGSFAKDYYPSILCNNFTNTNGGGIEI